jgi:hypothetical protein
MELHILLAGVEFGPYTDDQVRELLGDGFLSATDPAKRLDETDWLPLSDVLAKSNVGAPAPAAPARPVSSPPKFEPIAPSPEEPSPEPSAESVPELEPAAEETPEEIAEHEEPAAEEPVETSAPEPSAPTESPAVSAQQAEEEPESFQEEESSSARPPVEEEETSTQSRRIGPRQLTAEEKTAFLRSTATVRAALASPPTSTPPIQVSLPSRAKKGATRTGSLLAQDALRAARNRTGILGPTGPSSPEAPALARSLAASTAPATRPEPEAPSRPIEPQAKESTAPRRKVPVVLRKSDGPTPAPEPAGLTPVPAQRKAIRLTGRISLRPTCRARLPLPEPRAPSQRLRPRRKVHFSSARSHGPPISQRKKPPRRLPMSSHRPFPRKSQSSKPRRPRTSKRASRAKRSYTRPARKWSPRNPRRRKPTRVP